ncbi:MAG: hypothetical protein IJ643_07845 [Eubacterium sp.]|nr:hypothetical protein [Eubacterium sp.]
MIKIAGVSLAVLFCALIVKDKNRTIAALLSVAGRSAFICRNRQICRHNRRCEGILRLIVCYGYICQIDAQGAWYHYTYAVCCGYLP